MHGGANGDRVALFARQGGLVDLRQLAMIPDGGLYIDAADANSEIDLSALTDFTPDAAFSNYVESSNGATIHLGAGTTTVANALVTLSDGTLTTGTLVLGDGARLEGIGTLTVNLTNGGLLAAGVQGKTTGAINVSGNYVQTQDGTSNVVIDGTAAGAQFDQLVVGGTATLGGTLDLAPLGTFKPATSDRFPIVIFTSSSGKFTTVIGTDAGNGHSFAVDYEQADVKLSVQ
jgi:hypothetical protein